MLETHSRTHYFAQTLFDRLQFIKNGNFFVDFTSHLMILSMIWWFLINFNQLKRMCLKEYAKEYVLNTPLKF